MPQIFPRGSNTIARTSIVAFPLTACLIVWVMAVYARSTYGSGQGQQYVQPVPFSHQHHVGILGIDCRYCHTSVESAGYASIPATKVCMNCHSQIWLGSNVLQPVRESYRTDQSIEWQKVHNLPGFVYFNHSIHIHKGVGCTTCHGPINEMQFVYQEPSLLMEWCLDCHRKPENNLRPQADIFSTRWQRPADQAERGRELARQYHIHDPYYLTSCEVCHR